MVMIHVGDIKLSKLEKFYIVILKTDLRIWFEVSFRTGLKVKYVKHMIWNWFITIDSVFK